MLRERTNYLKITSGEVEDFLTDGRWVDVVETKEGGARLNISEDDLEVLDNIARKFEENGRTVGIEINENGKIVTIIDQNGIQIPFDETMKALFG